MNRFLRTAFYARVSSQKQADEQTIQSQRQDLIERIQHDQLVIAPDFQFCDDGYSGSELLRPALDKLRDMIASAMIDRLYVHSPDRLARKYVHQALLLEEFARHGCEVIFLNQQGLPESPETNLLLQLQGMISEFEREKILERTRRGRRYAAAAGSVSVFSGAPYGYRYISRKEGDGQARWEIDPHESQIVRLIFDLVAAKEMTLAGVCRELHARGIRTQTGKEQWDPSTLRGILINPAYAGRALYPRKRMAPRKPGKRAKRGDPPVPRRAQVTVAADPQEQVTIPVPPLVSESIFEQAAQRMRENQKRQRQRQNGPKYLLSGLTMCGECGSAYCSRRQGGKSYYYYRCLGTDKHRRGERVMCSNPAVRGPELEARVWSELCQLLRDPRRLTAELERRREQSPQSSAQLAASQRRLKNLRGRLDRLIDAYASGLLEKNEFESRIGPLRDQHDREAAALASLSGADDDAQAASALTTLAEFAEQVQHSLEGASQDLKRELITLLIKRVEIHRDDLRIVYKVPSAPFDPGPEIRGLLQHRLQRQQLAAGVSPQNPIRPRSESRECGDSNLLGFFVPLWSSK
ncbi:MAG: recombinase family protein [Planctomycetota bacterium]|nr:MAG: recombinase family protein [Planctomycetota bacterium]